eukprot:scaffold24638_cov96-Isochrysis_galbana.AAC.2
MASGAPHATTTAQPQQQALSATICRPRLNLPMRHLSPRSVKPPQDDQNDVAQQQPKFPQARWRRRG